MRASRLTALATVSALCALAVIPLASCGSASAAPLEVTYYYLPG
jgi:hypothetical protein